MFSMSNNGSGTSVTEAVAEIRKAQGLFMEYLQAADGRGPAAVRDPRVYHIELTREIRDLKGYCEREGLPVPDELISIEVEQKSLSEKLPRE